MSNTGLTAFRDLMLSLNATRGDKRWWILFVISTAAILGWIAIVIPTFFITAPDWIAYYNSDTGDFTLWSTLVVAQDWHNAFYLAVFLAGTPIVKIAWTWAGVSYNLALGRRFVSCPPHSILDSGWVKD